MTTKVDENTKNIGLHKEVLMKINETLKKHQQTADATISNLGKCNNKVDNVRSDAFANTSSVKEDLKERIGDLDKYYSESMEEMSNTIEQVRIMARDSVNAKEKEL